MYPTHHPKRWSVGIDPGMKCTAVTLLADDVPIAAEASTSGEKADKPIQHRVRMMTLWLRKIIQKWVDQYSIETLVVLVEIPFLNHLNVKTSFVQTRMLACYEECLFDLQNVEVWLGEISNTSVKLAFTGDGHAEKHIMISRSAWKYRPDVPLRDHLADSQAIGAMWPVLTKISDDELRTATSIYSDQAIGHGRVWQRPSKEDD